MRSKTYDIITVGGGPGGSALAKAMAEHGARVLVVERERHFKDRVRGEAMHPWGVAEAHALGIYQLLHEACGHEIPWRDTYLGPERIIHRDLSTTTPQGWWQGCQELRLPGYDPFGPGGANANLLVPNEDIDPISGSVPHRSQRCRVRKEGVSAEIST